MAGETAVEAVRRVGLVEVSFGSSRTKAARQAEFMAGARYCFGFNFTGAHVLSRCRTSGWRTGVASLVGARGRQWFIPRWTAPQNAARPSAPRANATSVATKAIFPPSPHHDRKHVTSAVANPPRTATPASPPTTKDPSGLATRWLVSSQGPPRRAPLRFRLEMNSGSVGHCTNEPRAHAAATCPRGHVPRVDSARSRYVSRQPALTS